MPRIISGTGSMGIPSAVGITRATHEIVDRLVQSNESPSMRRWLRSRKKESARPVTRWQEAFCRWNAERLGISIEKSTERYVRSIEAVPGGHGSDRFREFCRVFSVFCSDSEEEVLDAYRLFAPHHFLRMLSYQERAWPDSHPVVQQLAQCNEPTIADYGCGLAHASIGLALVLRDRGLRPSLFLADIPTMRSEFLGWFCRDLECQDAINELFHCVWWE